MKKLNLDQLKIIILSVLLLIVGVLFCCSLAIGIDGLSIIVGIVLLIIGVATLANSMLTLKTIYSQQGVVGSVSVALGVMFLVYKLAEIIFLCIPWFLMVVGVCIILDGVLCRFLFNIDGNVSFAIKMVLGVITFVLGLCLQVVDGFLAYASVMLGVLFIVLAIYMLLKFVVDDKQIID